jgi:transposase
MSYPRSALITTSCGPRSSAPSPGCDCVACRFGHGAAHPVRLPRYTSDMTDAEWHIIEPLLPEPAWRAGRGGRPEEYCRRMVIDAIRYVADNGIKWRNLPADFGLPWRTAHSIFTRWNLDGLLQTLHDRLRDQVRRGQERDAVPTAAIIDSQSVRAAETVGAGYRGWDAGKKVGGTKRHLAVDCLGLLLVVLVTAASVQDRDAALPLLRRLHRTFAQVVLVWADGGYAGALVDWARRTLGIVLHIVKRPADACGFVVLPRRWVVERTLSWIVRRRRCVRDYERLPAHHEAMVKWAMVMVMSKRLARARLRPG